MKYKLPKSLTTVTPFSKFLALSLFVALPLIFFYTGLNLGLGYNLKFNNLEQNYNPNNIGSVCQKGALCSPTVTPSYQSPTPTCIPRPKCLDSNPRCMIAETEDMCPPNTTPTK